ncbi:hypothetical protein [Paracoccus sp. ME4]|uniref:hypothetical protein n=1 Tax=Paracoccus sp. ME4 TaxID=3138066 RepID=UPI00398AC7A0
MTHQRRPLSYEISLKQIDQLKNAFTPVLFDMARVGISNQDANESIARRASDWVLFNGPRLAGGGGPAVAISASLGLVRPQLAAEKLCLRERDKSKGQTVLQGFLPPDEPGAERRFHVRVTHSTIGTSPEDAVRTFFDAVKTPAAMFAEIHEDGVEGVVEIDDAELARIVAGDGAGTSLAEPDDTPTP